MLKSLTKFIFIILTFLILILIVSPFLFDKKKIVLLINEKIKSEFKFDVNFDEDINISLFPLPLIKLKDVNIEDNRQGLGVKIFEVEISSSWKSIIRLNPEIQSIKLKSPEFNIENNLFSENRILISTFKKKYFERTNQFLNKFKSIKLINGKLNFKNSNKSEKFENIDFAYKNFEKKKFNLELNYLNYKSFFKISGETTDFKEFFYDINQQFENNNEIFGTGVVNLKSDQIFISGNLQSERLDFGQITKLISQFKTYKKNTVYRVNLNSPLINIDMGLSVDKIIYDNFIVNNFESKIFSKKENIVFDGLKMKHKNSLIKLDAIYLKKKELLNGKMLIYDFIIDKSFNNESKFYIDNALLNCEIDFVFNNQKKLKRVLNKLSASGNCSTSDVDLVGMNIEKIVTGIDNLQTFQDFFDLFNKEKMRGKTKIDSINLKFKVRNSILNIDEMIAKQKKMKVKSVGSYQFYGEKLYLKNNIFVKTQKFKDLPNFDLIINGTPKKYKITYDFEKIKSAVLSGGINSILKNKKRLIINPDSFKGLIDKDSKKINTEKIIDLFLD